MTTSPPQTPSQDVWPEEIRLSKAKDRLEIRFDDGAQFSLSAELLRVESPSAEVQGHGAGQKTTPAGKQDILISSIEPVGIMQSGLALVTGIIPACLAGVCFMIMRFARIS